MSTTVNISYEELEAKIQELQALRNEWNGYASTIKPTISGGGLAVSVLDEIGDSYVKLYQKVCELCDNTIKFLTNVKNSVDNTEQKAVDALK